MADSLPLVKPVGPLAIWLSRVPTVDRFELEAEWRRIRAAAVFDEMRSLLQSGSTQTAAAVVEQLCDPRMERLFSRFWADLNTADPLDPLNAVYALHAAQGMAAATLSLLHFSQGNTCGALEAASLSAACWSSSPAAPNIYTSGGIPQKDSFEFCSAVASALGSIGVETVWWMRALLRGAEPDTEMSANSCRLPEYVEGGEGSLATLKMAAVDGGCGRLMPHPILQGLTPMSRVFLETLHTAWQLSETLSEGEGRRRDYLWWITGPHNTDSGDPILKGPSHGLAAAVLSTLTRKGQRCDPEFTATGSISQEGDVGLVGGLYQKVRAAYQERNAMRLPAIESVYVPVGGEVEARRAAVEMGRDPDRAVFSVAKVADLLELATGVPAAVDRMRREELQEILAIQSAACGRSLTTVDEAEQLLQPLYVQCVSEDGSAATIGHWKQLAQNHHRVLLMGDAGSGKSTTIRLLIADTLVEGECRGDHRAAVYLHASSLAGVLRGETGSELALNLAELITRRRRIKSALLPGVQAQLADWLQGGQCLLAVDGFDELMLPERRGLASAFRILLADTQIHLVLGCRIGNADDLQGLFAPHQEMLLCPLTREDTLAILNRWFSHEQTDLQKRLEDLGPHTLEAVETPQAAWMICRLLEEETTERLKVRTQADLFHAYLMMGIRKWAVGPLSPTRFQADLLLGFACDFALEALQKTHYGAALSSADAVKILARVRVSFPALEGRDLMQDMAAAGFLRRQRLSHGEALYLFTHAAIGEYLAACSLARTARFDGFSAIADWVERHAGDPAWTQTIVFIASMLEDPEPLLVRLMSPRRDDMKRSRAVLAALCLPDIIRRSAGSEA